jgi:hypothetical protein
MSNHPIDPTYVIAGVIHGSTCEDTPPECIEYEGACVKAAKALTRALAGWTVGPSNDGSVDAGLYHTCESEPVAWMGRNCVDNDGFEEHVRAARAPVEPARPTDTRPEED